MLYSIIHAYAVLSNPAQPQHDILNWCNQRGVKVQAYHSFGGYNGKVSVLGKLSMDYKLTLFIIGSFGGNIITTVLFFVSPCTMQPCQPFSKLHRPTTEVQRRWC
jgi:hypothetical protein